MFAQFLSYLGSIRIQQDFFVVTGGPHFLQCARVPWIPNLVLLTLSTYSFHTDTGDDITLQRTFDQRQLFAWHERQKQTTQDTNRPSVSFQSRVWVRLSTVLDWAAVVVCRRITASVRDDTACALELSKQAANINTYGASLNAHLTPRAWSAARLISDGPYQRFFATVPTLKKSTPVLGSTVVYNGGFAC